LTLSVFLLPLSVNAQSEVSQVRPGIDFSDYGLLQTITGYKYADISGTFYIQNNYTDKFVDIHGPSTADGALIHEWVYHTNMSENWEISDTSDGYYTIKSLYSNKYIGVDSTNTGLNKNNIKQYSSINSYTKWVIYVDDYDNYLFKPYLWNSQFLTSAFSSAYNELQLTSYYTSSRAKWTLHKQVNISDGTYFIQNFETRKYADLCGPSTADGAIIHQWDLNASNLSSISSWRKWVIHKESDLYYTIKNVYSNKYLGLESGTGAVKQYSSIADNTKWKIYETDTDSTVDAPEYIITPKGPSYAPYTYVIGVEDGINSNGKDLQLKDFSSDSRISWDFTDASMTYYGRIFTWGYRDTRYNYKFSYFDHDFLSSDRDLYVYQNNLDTWDPYFTSCFSPAITHGELEWETALSPYIDFHSTSSLSSADIVIEGGTYQELGYDSLIGAGNSGGLGSLKGFVIYENEICEINKMVSTWIDVMNYAVYENQSGMNTVLAHEFGHNLGYNGHSPDSEWDEENQEYVVNVGVMNATYSTDEVQEDERDNVIQIWVIFYE
jgi:hypothetical protein